MPQDAAPLPNDPAALKAMIVALQTENQKMSASLRARDLLVQALRTRIAKLQKQKFGPSLEKTEREIEQLEIALEDLQVALAEAGKPPYSARHGRPEPVGVRSGLEVRRSCAALPAERNLRPYGGGYSRYHHGRLGRRGHEDAGTAARKARSLNPGARHDDHRDRENERLQSAGLSGPFYDI
ncbi:hypothetical protein E4L95_13365 [Paracoccus liaowanqingii]|uniref:Transposase TnpC homeodomain domain-containing protein n=1 Tax=Paracoccus liaowanqingii TaxID=2560053 RepID=A0A4Z1C232_9RHOB|nr:hypothetical protein E4L95_13365 [Paracoccus liaowanqingii]